MTDLKSDIRSFLAKRQAEWAESRQMAALQIVCGVDLVALKAADASQRALALGRIDRLLERERLKGLAGHWSYDLNRHIALKQAADDLRSEDPSARIKNRRSKQDGARRRRQLRETNVASA
jgi:hypothetical protein